MHFHLCTHVLYIDRMIYKQTYAHACTHKHYTHYWNAIYFSHITKRWNLNSMRCMCVCLYLFISLSVCVCACVCSHMHICRSCHFIILLCQCRWTCLLQYCVLPFVAVPLSVSSWFRILRWTFTTLLTSFFLFFFSSSSSNSFHLSIEPFLLEGHPSYLTHVHTSWSHLLNTMTDSSYIEVFSQLFLWSIVHIC